MSKTGKILKIVIFAVFIAALLFLTIYFWPSIISLKEETVRVQFVNKIQNLGFVGWLAMLGIQVGQIIVAFLPGEPVEIIMGIMYGTWGGLATCLLGIAIGSIIVYILAKLIGEPFIKLFINLDDLNKYKFLKDKSRVEATVFFLFFIPGIPKDALIYFAPALKIKPWRFFLIATFARIPSVITSTMVGEGISQNRWGFTIAVFAITAVISLAGILINRWYMKKLDKKKKCLIFDLDGTLLNTLGDLTVNVNRVLREKGYEERSQEEVRRFLGNGIKKLVELAAPQGISEEEYQQCYQLFLQYYFANLDTYTKPYDGIVEMLTKLKKQGYKIAIASNKHIDAVKKLSNKFFPDLIDLPLGVGGIIKPKPASDIIEKILSEFNLKNEDVIYFGDSEVDVETCLQNNLKCICVSWGFRDREDLIKAGATIIIDTPEDIERIIKEV